MGPLVLKCHKGRRVAASETFRMKYMLTPHAWIMATIDVRLTCTSENLLVLLGGE